LAKKFQDAELAKKEKIIE